MQKPDFNPEEVTKIIRGRRSMFVAQFKENDPIDDAIIEEMLEMRDGPLHISLLSLGGLSFTLEKALRSLGNIRPICIKCEQRKMELLLSRPPMKSF